jgi:hypothetical protein
MIIWELVAKREPQINWLYTRNNTLKREFWYDRCLYCCIKLSKF